MNEYEMSTWTFTKAHQAPVVVNSIYPMNEDQARQVAARRGQDVTGWKAKMGAVGVKVADEGDGKLHKYEVRVERIQYATVEVEARDEDEAREKAKEEADALDSYEWDDDGVEIAEVEDKGLADDEDDDE